MRLFPSPHMLTACLVLAGAAGASQVEPTAGQWRTWVLSSGRQFRPPAPPAAQATREELARLRTLTAGRDAAALRSIDYWLAGSPNDRWHELTIAEVLGNGNRGTRALTLLDVAVYDALVAAWDAKYAYHRLRPSLLDRSLHPVAPVPNSPSYPSEHAVVAGAASTILEYLFPRNAARFTALAEQAGQATLLAGLQYPSDVRAGLDLGRRVGALVVERARLDHSDAEFTGSPPRGPGFWNGQNPVDPMLGTWTPWVLRSGDQFRPPPPPAHNSAQKRAELAELRTMAAGRSPRLNDVATFWQYVAAGPRGFQFWTGLTAAKIAQHRLDDNPPRAARVHALASVAANDATIACWDAKYTYWAIHPFQLDPGLQTLFATPNHPSYPAAHGCVPTAVTRVLGHLFPSEAPELEEMARQAADSRLWAGLHFRSDIVAGVDLGRSVADVVIDRADHDGSQ